MPTFAQARIILQARIADSSNPAEVDEALNQAQREVARAQRWPELISRAFFTTVASYDTGTVALVNGDATVTLTGGTFPTNVATDEMRFALSVSDTWYPVITRTSGTIVELASPWEGDTDASSGFVLYKSHYSLDPTVDRVEEMWLHDSGTAVPLFNATTDQTLTAFAHFPSGPGTPQAFMSIERDASGNRQVLLGPDTPSAAKRVEYTFRRKTVDNTFNGNLDESRWPCILARASAILYEPEFYDRHLTAMAEYEKLLKAEWEQENETETQGFVVGQTRVDYPNVSGMGMDSLMGRGRVQDPS